MNMIKRITATLLACMMVLPAFACSSGNPGEGSSTAENSKSDPLTSEPDNIVVDENGGRNWILDFNENISGENPEDIINAVVTTIRGDDGKYYTPKTDINGTTITQSDGNPVTEPYTGTTLATTYATPDYTPAYKSYLAFWLDISKREDFVFDGNLLEFEIEVPKDAQDGVYPVEITMTDFSDYDLNGFDQIDTNVGYVCINSAEPATNAKIGDNMTLTPDTISVKPGDTARLKIRIDNNTGIVAFRLTVRYDSNAFTIVKAGAGDDLASRAKLTAHTIDEQA